MEVSKSNTESLQTSSAEMSTTPFSTAGTSQSSPAKGKRLLKRKADSVTNDKSKKKKKKTVKRIIRPNYTVQEGEDMLLIISNINSSDSIWKPKRKGCKKKKVNAKGKSKTSANKMKKAQGKVKIPKVTEQADDKNVVLESVNADSFDCWGQSLPIEVLVKIFQFAVLQDGAVPFLCRWGIYSAFVSQLSVSVQTCYRYYVTRDPKTSRVNFLRFIHRLSIYVWFVRIGQYFAEIQLFENIEKIAFKGVQIKFLAMYITNQKLSFDIFTVGDLQNIFMEHDLYLISYWFLA